MIRKLLATSAIAAVLATGAIAQDATQPAPADPAAPPATTAPAPAEVAPVAPMAAAEGFLASNLIGETVYNGTGDDAANIGDVNDLVIDKDGKIASVVVGVGGFLGIGEKSVALSYGDIDWAERDGDRWIVVAATKEELDALPAFDKTPYEPAAPAVTDPSATSATPPATTEPAPMQPAPAPADPAAPAPQQ